MTAQADTPIPTPPALAVRAFASLNLRCNPFGELPFQDRLALAQADPVDIPQGTVIQVLAPPGRGKTSLLLAQLKHRQDALYWRADSNPDPPRPEEGLALLLLDEAGVLAPRPLRRVIRPWPMVLAASHRDLSFRTGRPTRTILLEPLDIPNLLALLERRIEWARLGPGPLPRLDENLVEQLRQAHRGDVRAIEAALYEKFQALKESSTANLSHSSSTPP